MDRDVLGHALSFLTLSELHHANAVARTWAAAVCHMPPLNGRKPNVLLGRFVMTAEEYRERASSVLMRRHVAHLELNVSFSTPLLPADTEPFDYPPNLLSLRIKSERWKADARNVAALQTLLNGVRGCARLETLFLRCSIDGAAMAAVDLQPLLGLQRRLKELHWHGIPSTCILSPAQIDVVRQLHSLTEFTCQGNNMPDESFRLLMRAPFPLPLAELPIDSFSDRSVQAITSTLPAIEEFSPSTMQTSNLTFLQFLPSIRTLKLRWRYPAVGSPPASDLVAGVRHCSRVTELDLCQGPSDFAASHLASTLQATPLLEKLTIRTAPQLVSLAPFAEAGPHQSRLTWLVLLQCSVDCSMPPTEVKHLYSLTALKTLNLSDVCRLPAEMREELRPNLAGEENRLVPCAIPSLTGFFASP
jgi:hypothetical protein